MVRGKDRVGGPKGAVSKDMITYPSCVPSHKITITVTRRVRDRTF